MKIILRKDHEFLGNAGDVLEVKNGFARNFLIPNGTASAATKSHIKSYEETRKQQSRKIEKEKEEAKQLASKIESTEVTVQVKAGEENRVFGSVTSQMIFDALTQKGFNTIDKKKILLKEPIKTLGEHSVTIKLFGDISAAIKVTVEKEGTEHTEEKQQASQSDTKQEAVQEAANDVKDEASENPGGEPEKNEEESK